MAALEFLASILPFIAGVFLIILAIVVVSGRHLDRYRAYFCLFLFSAALWSIGISIFLWTKQYDAAYFIAVAYYVAALFIAYSLLVFARAIPSIKARAQPSSIHIDLLLLWPIVICMLWMVTTRGFISSVSVAGKDNTVVLNIPLYLIFALLFTGYVVSALAILYRKYSAGKKSSGHLYRVRLRLLAVSIVFGMVFGMVFNLILPLWGYYVLIWLGPIGIIPSALIFWYAILRHGLFDVKLVVTRTIAYFLLLGTLVALYATLALAIGRVLVNNASSAFIQDSADTISAIILAFSFQPLQRLFNRFTYRLFLKNDYSVSAVQQTLNEILATDTNIHTLSERALDVLNNAIGASFAHIIIYDDNKHYQYRSTADETTAEQHQYELEFAHTVQMGHKDVYTQGDLIETVDSDMKLLTLARKSHVAVALRLSVHSETIAVLTLGTKKNTSPYNNKDYQLLVNVSEELALAIQNSLRLSQIVDFNQNLQQKVDQATRELRASNRRLKALDDTKDEFISMASHQLRTPLTSVKGYISMILDGDAGKINDKQRRFLSEAFDSSNRMAGIISDFLNVSRLQTGKFEIEKEPVNLADLVESEVEHLRNAARLRSVELVYDKPRSFTKAPFDKSKIEQVIMNFIDNAIFYAANGKVINIELYQRGGNAVLKVKDHGIGVPKEEQAHLFTKFFRATNARHQRPDGTGVGLFLAKKVIVAHGGVVLFESTEGRGSMFGFELPLLEQDVNQFENKPDHDHHYQHSN